MGWNSANQIFDPIARTLIELNAAPEVKRRVLGDLISTLQDGDWDTGDESLEDFADDPAIVAAFADHGVHFTRADEDSDILDSIREIAAHLLDASSEDHPQAVNVIHGLAQGRLTIAVAREQLASTTASRA